MEKPKIEELKAALYWIAVNYQQNFYEISSDWNTYKLDEHVYLKNYIGYALYGPPEYEEECCETGDGIYIYKDEGAMKLIETLYNKLVEHGTQENKDKEIYCSILYNCFYDESTLTKCDESKLTEIINIIPLFKVQKNILKKNELTLQTWYIDTEARVYKSWSDYLKNNNLPTCVMISPKDGIYQADLKEVWSEKMSTVWVEVNTVHPTKKITNAVDIASTVVNIGCVGVGIAAIFNPISAPVVIAGVVGGAVSGVWGGGRATYELIDRGTHDQSISVTNMRALPAWLGVAGSTLGLAASSGSALLSRAIRTGTSVGKGAQIAHDAIMISNLLVNSAGVGVTSFNVYQRYKETGEISTKDIFFLTAHVLFICNSAVKMKFAKEIIKSDQNQILEEYEESLRSNRHKKEFRRLVRNTSNEIVDEVHRNEQIIRSLTKISNKDEFFATMVQNRKMFATTGTQLSFAEGQVQINGVTLINPSTLASMSKESILTLVNQSVPNTSSTSSVPTNSSTFGSSGSSFISANALKAGISTLRNFYVQKSVGSTVPGEAYSSEYKGIINDLQNVPDMSNIFKLLLETGMCIVKKIVTTQRYSEEDALADATNFIWSVVKINFASTLPGINVYDIRYHDYIKKLVQATYDYVKGHSEEWTECFRNRVNFLNSLRQTNISEESSMGTSSAESNVEKSSEESSVEKSSVDSKMEIISEESDVPNKSRQDYQVRYNDIILLDPTEVMRLPKEISILVVQEALNSTGTRINDTDSISKDLIKLCEEELTEFFSKHPMSINFKLNSLSEDFKGILLDLKHFERKNIIFYKLLVISTNITQGLGVDEALEKDVLVDVMKCLWIFVNMNFGNILPEDVMFKQEYESFVINILIALYRYQIKEPNKWSSAFYEYREKFKN